MLRVFKAFQAYVVLALLACASLAANAKSPTELVENAANGLAKAIMANKKKVNSDSQFIAELIETHMIPIVDQHLFAKLSLGKKNWESANPQQQKDFIDGFKKMLIKSYAGAFKAYNGEKMTFEEPKYNKKQSKAMIFSKIIREGDEPIEVRYMLYKKNDKWLMYDAIVGGLDLVKTYRSQLSEQIAKDGLDKTIKELKNTKLD